MEEIKVYFLIIAVTLRAFCEIKSSIVCSIVVFLAMLCTIKVGGALVPRCCMWCRIACGVGLRYVRQLPTLTILTGPLSPSLLHITTVLTDFSRPKAENSKTNTFGDTSVISDTPPPRTENNSK